MKYKTGRNVSRQMKRGGHDSELISDPLVFKFALEIFKPILRVAFQTKAGRGDCIQRLLYTKTRIVCKYFGLA